MEQRLAQAAPSTGASNASDFQPTTRNPQTAPSSVQQTGLQGVTNPQEFLNDNQATQLTVVAEPASAPVAPASKSTTPWILIAIAAVALTLLLLKVLHKPPFKKSTKTVSAPIIPEPTESVAEPVPEAQPKKTQPKRKASKKTKRRNR